MPVSNALVGPDGKHRIMALSKKIMDAAFTAPGGARTLLNASVLVFLFRAMAGATTKDRRDHVAVQILSLLRDFVPCVDGFIVVGSGESDVATQFRERAAAFPTETWHRLTSDGAWSCSDVAAIPLYATGSLTGCMVLRLEGEASEHMEALSAVASLAAVAIESER